MTATLPVSANRSGHLATLDQLTAIPEEEIWLAKQKSAQTRRAYKLDVRHFMRALGIIDVDQVRSYRMPNSSRVNRVPWTQASPLQGAGWNSHRPLDQKPGPAV
jgi:hypothetical protein